MSERKGLTKYYPPDFDPSKLARVRKPRGREISSHFMLPMSVRCETCGEFMGAGLKFNAKKSTADETYLGMKIFRFSMKCKACPASFIIKTDPEHQDYVCEVGAKRNFQPWRADKEAEDESRAIRQEQDRNTMQALENKTLDAQREMEDLDELDEIKARNALRARVSTDELLRRHRTGADHDDSDGEEALLEEARTAFANKRAISSFDKQANCISGESTAAGVAPGNIAIDDVKRELPRDTHTRRDLSVVGIAPSKRKLFGDIMSGKVVLSKPKRVRTSDENDCTVKGSASNKQSAKEVKQNPTRHQTRPSKSSPCTTGLVAYGSDSGSDAGSSASDAR